MCGLAGWVVSKTAHPPAHALSKMADAIARRGPDGRGEFFTRTRSGQHHIALAHRRLAIIDLTTGAQPMRSEDGAVTLVYNGEVYNFRELRAELQSLGYAFTTASDTEVVLNAYRAWGTGCLGRLRGMFAFALWDGTREQLFLARDRFGEKPLYLWQSGDGLVFASEIKALLAHPAIEKETDYQSVLDFLQYRYVPSPHTMFRNIVKLPPGSFALWKNGALTTQHYYLPPDGEPLPPQQPQPAAFLPLLEEAVRLRMVADVPLGAFLSGGLDSSAIVALMARQCAAPVNTFSVGFKEAQYSELNYARLVAQRFKTQHHELIVTPSDIIHQLPACIAHRDAPLAEPADIPMHMLSAFAAQSVKVALSGEGADEILAGYPKHRFEPYVSAYHAIVPARVRRHLIEPLAHLLPARFYRLQTLIHSFALHDSKERYPRWFGSLSLRGRKRLVALNTPERPVHPLPFAAHPRQSALRRLLYFDQTSWLPDNLLERGDRMTMAASLEARMPFMDHELATLVSRCPDHARIRGGKQKWLLREAMKDILPAEILTRPKVGFRVPVSLWLRTTLKDFTHDHLLGNDSKTRGFYRPRALQSILAQHSTGRANHEKLIWALLNLELFQRQYGLG